jgi:hypothetical protein
MTDQELKDLVASLAVAQAKTEAKIDRLSELYGGVSSSQGASEEEFFFNSLSAHPVLGGIKYDRVSPNVTSSKGKKQAEFDIVMVNGKSVAVIEVKYKVHPSDIEKTEKNLKRYREFYPEHKNFDLYGGIAGFSVPADAVKAAKEKGLFVLKRKGDVVATDAKGVRAL